MYKAFLKLYFSVECNACRERKRVQSSVWLILKIPYFVNILSDQITVTTRDITETKNFFDQ